MRLLYRLRPPQGLVENFQGQKLLEKEFVEVIGVQCLQVLALAEDPNGWVTVLRSFGFLANGVSSSSFFIASFEWKFLRFLVVGN